MIHEALHITVEVAEEAGEGCLCLRVDYLQNELPPNDGGHPIEGQQVEQHAGVGELEYWCPGAATRWQHRTL